MTTPATPSLLTRAVGCAVVFGSLWVALDAPPWVQVAFAVTFVDVFLLKRVMVRWAFRVPWLPGGAQLLLVLLVWPLIPSAWVGCAIRQLTGSWIIATVIAVPLAATMLVRLLMAAERERQRAARGGPVPAKRRTGGRTRREAARKVL